MGQSKNILIVIAVIAVLVIVGAWWWGSSKGTSANPSTTATSAGVDTGTAAQKEAGAGKGISTERVKNPPVPTNVAAPSAQLTPPSAPAPIVP